MSMWILTGAEWKRDKFRIVHGDSYTHLFIISRVGSHWSGIKLEEYDETLHTRG